MVVHLGESQVFKRHVPQASHGCVDIYRAGAHLLEQCAQLVLIHDARISECRKWRFPLGEFATRDCGTRIN